MAYTPHPTVVPGDTWTASNQNTYIRDNFNALWVGQGAGDMDYYSGSNTKARLAKPSALSILQHSGSTPSWLAAGAAQRILRVNSAGNGLEWVEPMALSGLLHARASVTFNANDQLISGGTYVDVSGATCNIVTSRTCTIKLTAIGTFAAGGGGQRVMVRGVIGGTNSADLVHTSMTVYVPYTVVYYRTGVGAGTITCKIQGRGNGASNSGYFHQGLIMVEAYTE